MAKRKQSSAPSNRDSTDSNEALSALFFALCKSVDSPVSLGAWIRFRAGEYLQLIKMEIDPLDYNSADLFRADYVVVSYLSKYEGFQLKAEDGTKHDPCVEAARRFETAEDQCRSANVRIQNYLRGEVKLSPRAETAITLAREKIAMLLERAAPRWSALDRCRWGPGSTATLAGARATRSNKLREGRISVSRLALPLLRAAASVDIHWLRARGISVDGWTSMLNTEFCVRDYCKITTVRKNSFTDRTIGIEPTGNIFLQLGVGSIVREALMHVGINLDDQSVNQELAWRASLPGSNLATFDMKMASDTICRAAIWLLLPLDWATFLDTLRSTHYRFEGIVKPFEKWSSMGNGYTFELESLVFWALASAVKEAAECEGIVSVYGDDIIAPAAIASDLQELFSFLGFTFNEKKSHTVGPFRESCGRHYFDGKDVTPIYQKESLVCEDALVRCYNRISRLVEPSRPRTQASYNWDAWLNGERLRRRQHNRRFKIAARVKPFTRLTRWLDAARRINASTNHFQPLDCEGDFGLRMNLEEIPLNRIKYVGTIGYLIPGLIFKPKRVDAPPEALYALLLRFGLFTRVEAGETLRRVGRYRSKWRFYSRLEAE